MSLLIKLEYTSDENSRDLHVNLFDALAENYQFGRYVRNMAGHSEKDFLGFPVFRPMLKCLSSSKVLLHVSQRALQISFHKI
jgi:hypothetical protein